MTSRALEETLGTAGAAFVARGRARVAAHFGSVAGEMAVCRHGVGLADRSGGATLELRGGAGAVAEVVHRMTGRVLAPGAARHRRGAWWCPVTRHRILVLVDEPAVAAPLGDELERTTVGVPGASAIDLSEDYAAIGLVGPRAEALLHAARLLDPGTPVGAFAPRLDALTPALLLREDADRFLLLVPAAHARRAWDHLMAVGRVYGASCVGRDALGLLAAGRRAVEPRR